MDKAPALGGIVHTRWLALWALCAAGLSLVHCDGSGGNATADAGPADVAGTMDATPGDVTADDPPVGGRANADCLSNAQGLRVQHRHGGVRRVHRRRPRLVHRRAALLRRRPVELG